MKRILFSLILVIAVRVSHAQNIEGQIIASQYGQWRVEGYSADTYSFAPTACRVKGGASFFVPFQVGTPALIADGNPALNEVVTPSALAYNNQTCSVTITPANHHQLPFYLASATGGLQEALNANMTNPGINTIILSNDWYRLGGTTAIIGTVKGSVNLNLVDVTTAPSTWYVWNVTAQQYQVVQIAGSHDPGDYTCDMVTNCWNAPGQGFQGNTASAITPSSMSVSMAFVGGNPGSEGYFFMDSEWMHYVAYSGGGTGTFTLGPDRLGCPGRGCFGDTPASHVSGSTVFGAVFVAANPNQPPYLSVVGNGPSTWVSLYKSHPGTGIGGVAIFLGQNTYIDINGGIHQFQGGGSSSFLSPLYIGNSGVGTSAIYGFLPIYNTTNVVQTNIPTQMRTPIGLGSGVSGNVEAVQPSAIGAPTLTSEFLGSGPCSITYVITGTDMDGNAIPGTNATISNLPIQPWTFPANIKIQGQPAAGAQTFHAYRVSTSGCGTVTTGQWSSPISNTNYPIFQDNGATADGSVAPTSNTSIPKLCTNGEQFCILSGVSSVPPLNCGTSQEGWEYHDVAAGPAYHLYRCQSGSWTGIN